MPNVRKTGTGNYGKFAELHELIEAVRGVLAKNGLAFMQDVSGLPDGRIGVTTILVHTSGETIATGPLPMPAPADPQKVGSAITYARRYALMATLGIATEDDDGQAAKPAPEPTYSAAATALFTACRKLPDDRKAALKAFATENDRKVSTAVFDTDPAWADQVRAFIQLEARETK
jgi:hypothetical protein